VRDAAGQQHYGAAVWSGDISSTWTALRAQIPAGLGLSVSGLPYWSMDIGGFSVPERFATAHPSSEDVEEWRELNTRWFEFGAFVPLLPFLIGSGHAATLASILASATTLFTVGALMSIMTGKRFYLSGSRMLVIGLGLAAITYGVGRLLHVGSSAI